MNKVSRKGPTGSHNAPSSNLDYAPGDVVLVTRQGGVSRIVVLLCRRASGRWWVADDTGTWTDPVDPADMLLVESLSDLAGLEDAKPVDLATLAAHKYAILRPLHRMLRSGVELLNLADDLTLITGTTVSVSRRLAADIIAEAAGEILQLWRYLEERPPSSRKEIVS